MLYAELGKETSSVTFLILKLKILFSSLLDLLGNDSMIVLVIHNGHSFTTI